MRAGGAGRFASATPRYGVNANWIAASARAGSSAARPVAIRSAIQGGNAAGDGVLGQPRQRHTYL